MTEAEVRSMCILALKMKAKEHGQSLEPERVKEQILPRSVQKESSFANSLILSYLRGRTLISLCCSIHSVCGNLFQ